MDIRSLNVTEQIDEADNAHQTEWKTKQHKWEGEAAEVGQHRKASLESFP